MLRLGYTTPITVGLQNTCYGRTLVIFVLQNTCYSGVTKYLLQLGYKIPVTAVVIRYSVFSAKYLRNTVIIFVRNLSNIYKYSKLCK